MANWARWEREGERARAEAKKPLVPLPNLMGMSLAVAGRGALLSLLLLNVVASTHTKIGNIGGGSKVEKTYIWQEIGSYSGTDRHQQGPGGGTLSQGKKKKKN